MDIQSLIVTANGTKVRAFHRVLDPDNPDALPHLREVALAAAQSKPSSIAHIPTDQAGRFEKGNPPDQPQGYAAGEAHDVDLENRRRQSIALAESISGIAESEAVAWSLVAPASWINLLEEHLSKTAKGKLVKMIPGDWTGMSLALLEKKIEK